MDYETFGEHQWKETGIFDFMRALPGQVFSKTNFGFRTPNEVSDILQPVSAIHVPFPISWADEERDLTAWLGNELQDDAFNRLYDFEGKVNACSNEDILRDWKYLQTSDHFYYMCTKWFSDGDVHKYFNPYNSPYEAYVNFMNILSDFIMRVDNISAGKFIEKHEPEPIKKIKKAKVKTSEKKTSIKVAKKNVLNKPEFEDIFKLNKTQIKKILKSTDLLTLKTAFSGIPKKTENIVIFNLGFRTLKEYNAMLLPESLKQSKILSCRKSITDLIKKTKK
jgi:alpha-amylase/alpha-mannosidase (GH57 family)